MSGWRSVDCIGLYQSALSRKSPEEERPKTVQIVQVCAVKKEHNQLILINGLILEMYLGELFNSMLKCTCKMLRVHESVGSWLYLHEIINHLNT